jgi:hypothetical protein
MRRHAATFAALALTASPAAADPICADRPGKANPTCTVPAGVLQMETGLADWTSDRAPGVRTDTLALGATALKYGLGERAHIELDVSPYTRLRERVGGLTTHDTSFGDLVVRAKVRATGGHGVQVAVSPFVKIPTARRPIGNRRWEAGFALPIDYSIPGSPLAITLGPEIDWVADDDGRGHHAAMVQVVGLGWQASPEVSVTAELWGQWNWDPAGTERQATADAAVAWLLQNDLQLDGGANVGLNRQTPDLEVYAGIAKRF